MYEIDPKFATETGSIDYAKAIKAGRTARAAAFAETTEGLRLPVLDLLNRAMRLWGRTPAAVR